MTTITSVGPSSKAEWKVIEVETDTNLSLPIRFLPDKANDALQAKGQKRIRYALPDKPSIAMDADGSPIFSLTLVLSRQPLPEENGFSHLIQEGIVSFDTTLSLSKKVLEQLHCSHNIEYRPLFASNAEFSLLTNGDNPEILAKVNSVGSNIHIALTTYLNSIQAQSILFALNGQDCDITLQAKLQYMAVGNNKTIHLNSCWADIYDYISESLGKDNEFDGAQLKQCIVEILNKKILTVYDVSTGAIIENIAIEIIYPIFLSQASIILQFQTPERSEYDENNRYILRDKPHSMFNLDYKEDLLGDKQLAQVILSTKIDKVLKEIFNNIPLERFVHLVVKDSIGSINTLHRVHSKPQCKTGNRRIKQPIKLVAFNNKLESVSLAIAPEKETIKLKVDNIATRPNINQTNLALVTQDIVFNEDYISKLPNLPIINNPKTSVWRDRYNRKKYWYAPSFMYKQPLPTESVDSSPFLFEYEVTGATMNGKPALKASIHINLTMTQSKEVEQELARLGNPKSSVVNIDNLSVSLKIPFIDNESGKMRTHNFLATVSRQKDKVIATVELINDWVRLCYGALAYENFQSQPISIQIAYSFQAYVPVKKDDIQLVFGGKTAIVPVLYAVEEIKNSKEEVYLNAAKAELHLPIGVLNLKRSSTIQRNNIDHHATNYMANTVAAIRPQLAVTAEVIQKDKVKYAQHSIVHQESIDVLYPCSTLGTFYREKQDMGFSSIGCQDALKLGNTIYKQYEEIDDQKLKSDYFRVFRSLQQPGRFLVLPKQYCITRREEIEENNIYKPSAILYSVVDSNNPMLTKVFFDIMVQPNIPPFIRQSLLDILKKNYAEDPILEYPTEVTNSVKYQWVVSKDVSTPYVLQHYNALQISINTDLGNVLLLLALMQENNISGSIDFKLDDGTELNSSISLSLNNIIGPWKYGPIQVKKLGDRVELINCIDQPVAITSLHRYKNNSKVASIDVNITLDREQSHTILLQNSTDDLYPEYTLQSPLETTLQEERIFVEDITTNIIFFVQFDYQDHNLQSLEIQARLMSMPDNIYTILPSGSPPIGEIQLILPLTEYLSKQELQFQVVKIDINGECTNTEWISWDLEKQTNIVLLSWEFISG